MSEDDWKSKLRLKLEALVDDCVVAGVSPHVVFDELVRQIDNLRAALEHDPDPAEDMRAVFEEPSNDWPAASK